MSRKFSPMSEVLQVLVLMAIPAVWLSVCRYLIRRDDHLAAEAPAESRTSSKSLSRSVSTASVRYP